jgi:molybdate transport system regulatory protein
MIDTMTPSPLHYTQALGHEVTDKRLDILRRIGELGSISEAARSAHVSYKAAWQSLETLSNLAGAPLVEKAVGGSGGGGARLTQAGIQLLEAAELLEQARSTVLQAIEQRAGNALNMTGLVGLGLRTSMRNQLPCTVQAINHEAGITRVTLALPHGAILVSKITLESAELLGLKLGLSALALCKATAVQITTEPPLPNAQNPLQGQVLGATPIEPGQEAALRLSKHLQLIGFNSSSGTLQADKTVVATVDEAAVVIALPG